MYYPTSLLVFMIFVIAAIAIFMVTITRTRQILLIHKFYFVASSVLILWLIALIGARFTDPRNTDMLEFWDSVMTVGGAVIPLCSLLFSICYTKEYSHHLPRHYWLLFVIPALTIALVFTNKYHHLFYRVFSLVNTSVEFGPYFYVHSFYAFGCAILSVVLIIRFAIKTKTRLHILQAVLFTIGGLAPSAVNILLLCNLIEANVAWTPISFIVTIIFHGIIIYRLHLFDIRPIAMQQLINWIGDCYVVTNPSGLVVSCNKPFMDLIGTQYAIKENQPLQNCLQNEDVENKTPLYNLLSGINSCGDSCTRITYEQSFNRQKNNEPVKAFYMVEITPLIMQNEVCGFLSIFRDITQVKENMQRLQDSQVKMMEQERLAFLGQMVGGLAHNLKTPIMSISGSVSAVDNLIEESRSSIGDPDVTADDFREIYAEMDTWLNRVRDACTYMSDIISAVKGQAGNMSVSDSVDFSLSETFKRVSLLLRHELLNHHCTLCVEYDFDKKDILLHGDINNLVQVINNLVSNAIDAQLENGRHDIIAQIRTVDQNLQICIKDFGSGIPPQVRAKLLQQMVTSKGTMGTGLGVFISNTVIRAKFDGTLWFDDNPAGGTIWGISIPLGNVSFINRERVNDDEKE